MSTSLMVTARVYDSGSTLVRTLVNGSQAVGNQSVVWDGKNDAVAVQPARACTVKVNATDGQGLAAPEQTTSVTIAAGRLLTLDYQYDRLYRLTSATFPSGGTTTCSYDPVGNRGSMARSP